MARVSPSAQAAKLAPQRNTLRRNEAFWGILCVTPAVIGFLVWQLGPIIASLALAFTDWSVAGTPNWIGLDNFQHMVSDPLFFQSLRVTAFYALISVPLGIVVAFSVALLLNQSLRGLPIFRTIFYIPSLVPTIANSMLWLWLLNPEFGLFNAVLRSLGLPKLQWIYSSQMALPSLILMSLWGIGPMVIIFLAGLQGVPRHLYEAVEVDGGSAWHRLIYVTIPLMTPTIFFNFVLSIIGAFQTFVQGYTMTNGGPNNSTLFYLLYLYRSAFAHSEMGYASALAWVLFIIIAVLSFLVFRSSSSWVYYEQER